MHYILYIYEKVDTQLNPKKSEFKSVWFLYHLIRTIDKTIDTTRKRIKSSAPEILAKSRRFRTDGAKIAVKIANKGSKKSKGDFFGNKTAKKIK